jgi:hypothetical protein
MRWRIETFTVAPDAALGVRSRRRVRVAGPFSPPRCTPLGTLAALVAVSALSACAIQPQPPEPQPAPPPPPPPPVVVLQPVPIYTPTPDALSRFNAPLWDFQERLRRLDGPALAQERARAEARHVQDPEDRQARLQLVLALAQERGNGQVARALGLLAPLLAEPAEAQQAPWQPLAALLHERLSEQRRLEEQTERQAQQLREQQRRIEQLGAQIEALRAIERSLTARPIPNAAPPGEPATPPPPAPAPAPR